MGRLRREAGGEAAGGVADVLAWMRRAGLAQTVVDIVGMDEFEYDFLIRLRPDGEWVAFGVT